MYYYNRNIHCILSLEIGERKQSRPRRLLLRHRHPKHRRRTSSHPQPNPAALLARLEEIGGGDGDGGWSGAAGVAGVVGVGEGGAEAVVEVANFVGFGSVLGT